MISVVTQTQILFKKSEDLLKHFQDLTNSSVQLLLIKSVSDGGGVRLHLLGGVSVPGVVLVLAVLLRPQPTDFTVFLKVLGLCLHGLRFSEKKKQT